MTFAKDDVTAVEPRCFDGGDEELGAVGVGACIGHTQQPGLGVLLLEIFILWGMGVAILAGEKGAVVALRISLRRWIRHQCRHHE